MSLSYCAALTGCTASMRSDGGSTTSDLKRMTDLSKEVGGTATTNRGFTTPPKPPSDKRARSCVGLEREVLAVSAKARKRTLRLSPQGGNRTSASLALANAGER